MFLFAVAQLLETYSMERARHAIKAMMDLSPWRRASIGMGASRPFLSRRSPWAKRSSFGRGQRIRLTAWYLPGARRSIRRRSRANRCRSKGRYGRLRRFHKRAGTARDPRHEARRGHDPRSHHPFGRAGTGLARAFAILRRPILARLHAGSRYACRRRFHPSAIAGTRRMGRLVLLERWRCSSLRVPARS